MNEVHISKDYQSAKAQYAAIGVDVEAAMDMVAKAPVALHCWQGDDVRGFDTDPSKPLTGGIQTTGNYPGRARTPEELMADIDMVLKLCQNQFHRLSLQSHVSVPDRRSPACRHIVYARSVEE